MFSNRSTPSEPTWDSQWSETTQDESQSNEQTPSDTQDEAQNNTQSDKQDQNQDSDSWTPTPQQPTQTTDQDNQDPSSSLTLEELTRRLESQQSEARRLENKAAFVENDDARRFALSALLRVWKKLQEVRSSTDISASEVYQTVEVVDDLISKSSEALGE